MELNDKILKAIQEDLPSATAGELKKFIEDANLKAASLEQHVKNNHELGKQIAELKQKEVEFKNAENLRAHADKALEDAKKLTDKYNLDMKDEQIKQRDFVIGKFEGFLSNLVKNPRAIELISEQRNVPVFETYAGGGGHHTTQTEFSTGSKEKTETKD